MKLISVYHNFGDGYRVIWDDKMYNISRYSANRLFDLAQYIAHYIHVEYMDSCVATHIWI